MNLFRTSTRKFILLIPFAIMAIQMNAQELPSKVDIMTDEIKRELNASFNATNTGGLFVAGGAFITVLSSLTANYGQGSNPPGGSKIGTYGFYLGGVLIGFGGIKLSQGAIKRREVLRKFSY